jgi:hypothetical protein
MGSERLKVGGVVDEHDVTLAGLHEGCEFGGVGQRRRVGQIRRSQPDPVRFGVRGSQLRLGELPPKGEHSVAYRAKFVEEGGTEPSGDTGDNGCADHPTCPSSYPEVSARALDINSIGYVHHPPVEYLAVADLLHDGCGPFPRTIATKPL